MQIGKLGMKWIRQSAADYPFANCWLRTRLFHQRERLVGRPVEINDPQNLALMVKVGNELLVGGLAILVVWLGARCVRTTVSNVRAAMQMLGSRLQRPSPRKSEAPRRNWTPLLGTLPSQKRPVDDEAGAFLLLPGTERLLEGKEPAEPSQPGKSPTGV